MNDCKILHETIVRDIIDIIDYAKDVDPDDVVDHARRNPLATTSIARVTSNLVLTFPVICSRNITIENATMTAKAIERKAVSMLQILFSAFQVTNATDAASYIRQFHSNIKLDNRMTVDEFINYTSTLAESCHFIVNQNKLKAIKEDMRNISFYFEENIPSNLNSTYKINTDATGAKKVIAKESAGYNWRCRKDAHDAFAKQLLDSDVKKANELVPTNMVVNLMTVGANDEAVPIDNIVIGVKARMIPMDSDDIINHILTKVEDRKWILNFVRATTREISFVKDFLLAIDKAKVDALSNSRRGSSNPMWKVLERRSFKSRIKRFLGRSNDASAITTVVVSQEEVDYVRKENNIDFEDYKTISPVMDAYNLMGFVILDESLEVAKFLFDTGEGNWENLSFRNLERENDDTSYKRIVNLMTKMSR